MEKQIRPKDKVQSILKSINTKTSEILSDRKNSNQLIDLIDLLQKYQSSESKGMNKEDHSTVLLTLCRCLTKIFTNFIDSRELILYKENSDHINSIKNLNKYKSWLIKLYETVVEEFLNILSNKNSTFSTVLRKSVLQSVIKFIEEEGKFPFRQAVDSDSLSFPVDVLEKILRIIASPNFHSQDLNNLYCKYYRYDDFIHFSLKILHQIIDENHDSSNSNLIANFFDLLSPIRLITPDDLLPRSLSLKKKSGPKDAHKTWVRLCELKHFDRTEMSTENAAFIPIDLPIKKFKFDYKRDANLYSSLWRKFLRFPLNPMIFKRSLVCIDNHALQHFVNPLELADFLIDSFQTGGLISLLSLSPLYILMHKCNLEYPNFFGQLYRILDSAIIYIKHRSRFLFWLDLFLTSTHLPATIVASFVKRLSRICLVSTPDTILILLPFIGNLFIRHPLIKCMLNHQSFRPEEDPFLLNEMDPLKTKALESYVWELATLRSHYIPKVTKLIDQIFTELPRCEWKIEDLLETSLDDVIEEEIESVKKFKKFTYNLDCDLYNEF